MKIHKVAELVQNSVNLSFSIRVGLGLYLSYPIRFLKNVLR